MCTNHNPSGNDIGALDNLQTWNHGQSHFHTNMSCSTADLDVFDFNVWLLVVSVRLNPYCMNPDQFAVYLTNTIQHFEEHVNVTFDSVEAFNEPNSDWFDMHSWFREFARNV